MATESGSLLHRATRSAMHSSLGTAMNFVIGFLFAGLSIRFLGESRAGYFMLLASILGVNALMGDWGFGTAAVKRVAELNARGDLRRARRVIGSVCLISGGSSVAIALVLGLLFPWIFTWSKLPVAHLADARYATWLTLATFVLTQFGSTWRATYGALERYDLASMWNGLYGLLNGVLGIGVLLWEPTMTALAAVRLALGVARLLTDAWSLQRLLAGAPWPCWEREELRGMASFGGWVMVESLGTVLLGRINSLILTTFLGSAALPYYEFPQRLFAQVHSALANQAQFLFPMFASFGENAAQKIKEVEDKSRWLIAMASALAYSLLVLFGPELLKHTVGAEAAEMMRVPLYLACVQGFFHAINIFPYYCCYALGHSRLNSLNQVGHGVLVAATGALMIPRLGVLGASLSQCWIIAVFVVYGIWFHRKIDPERTGLAWLVPLASPALLFAVAVLSSIGMGQVADRGLPFRAASALVGITAGLAVVILYERAIAPERGRLKAFTRLSGSVVSRFSPRLAAALKFTPNSGEGHPDS